MTVPRLFFVEHRLPRITDPELALLQATLNDACLRLTARGEAVRYLGSTYLPGSARLLSMFEAATAEAVRTVSESSQAPASDLEAAIVLPPPATRVVIADDSALFREGLRGMLTRAGFEVAGLAADAASLLEIVADTEPDVAITDIRMPPTLTVEGLDAARRIRAAHPSVGVLVLSTYVETDFAEALLRDSEGRSGYLLKDRVSDLDELTDAIRRITRGGVVIDSAVVAELLSRRRPRDPVRDLSDRERDVLRLMAEGRSNQAIGGRLFLSPRTVEAHIRSIFTKLDLASAAEDHRRVLALLAFLRT